MYVQVYMCLNTCIERPEHNFIIVPKDLATFVF